MRWRSPEALATCGRRAPDREQVIDTLKVAFMQGRLTKGALDVGLGRALAARTYAELAAVIADIPARSSLAQPPKSARAQLQRPRTSRSIRAYA